jgi:hypothetical protein
MGCCSMRPCHVGCPTEPWCVLTWRGLWAKGLQPSTHPSARESRVFRCLLVANLLRDVPLPQPMRKSKASVCHGSSMGSSGWAEMPLAVLLLRGALLSQRFSV